MSESPVLDQTAKTHQTIYRQNYQLPNYLMDEVTLHINLQKEYTRVKSKMKIKRNVLSADKTKKLILNGEELILESIKLNDSLLDQSHYECTDRLLILQDVPDDFTLEVTVKIFPQNNAALSGLYCSAKAYCTQCEAEGFRRITYFLDHPDVLVKFTTTIEADATHYPYLLSNGNLISSDKLNNGRHSATWEDPFKKPSYLFALVAGDFDLLEDTFITMSKRRIQLRLYVEKGYIDQAPHAMNGLKMAMRWDENAFGREYDLDTYMIVAINDFNMGAMENKGLNIFNTKNILAKPETATDDDFIHIVSVIGHEYFHNWTGNRVTCRDWFQLSLKEGLTVFREQLFSEDTFSRAVMRIRNVNILRETQFPEDAGPLAHPVRPDSYIEINNFYTATVYNKGAEVLRMLRTLLGKELFRKGMDLYFKRYDGQAVTIEDYVKAMEDVSQMDLTQFKRWYAQAGTPIITATSYYEAQQKIYTLTMKQTCAPTPQQPDKQPMHIPIRIGLLNTKGEAIPLQLENESIKNNIIETEKILHLKEASQVFQFKNISSNPLPSLLRGFSAPVKLKYDYSDEELLFLFKHDKDDFNCWEAGQQYALRAMLHLIQQKQNNKPLVFPQELIDIYKHILLHDADDKLFLAEMLSLPSERYLSEQMDVVDVEAIHVVREFILDGIAQQLHELFLKTYQDNSDATRSYEFNIKAVGKRQLKNISLTYLMRLPQYIDIAQKQFTAALKLNMTDTLAALATLSHVNSAVRIQALEAFYKTWKQDALVLDKWFAIQAASKLPTALQEIKKLVQHEAFDIKNPNKVYALIGTFGQRNAICFHAKNGEGYVFLREMVQQLDKLNPQVSARMVKPFMNWKRYNKAEQGLMRKQLELLLQDKKISVDLYELVTKSLN